ncbi:MAG TPA: hypothetical protein PLR32_05960, partial [candidate division Zixibacteria bacterium]|nr:hypothetical protein [candidate division Zixibacteria bacterium]
MVRTDMLQFVLMFLGFIVMLGAAVARYGGWSFLRSAVPADHFTWHGGNAPFYVAIWYVIALATLIEPAFYQRCYAATSVRVARVGIYISIAFWAVFDFLTTVTGMYARAILPELADPVSSYPALAFHLLPPGLLGIFALGLLATVMSTVDSYAHIAATTFGNDIVGRAARLKAGGILFYSRLGLVISSVLAILVAIFFRSVVDIWHAFGSVGTPALLVPVVTSFVGRRRLRPAWALLSIVACGGLSALWLAASYVRADGGYWFGIQPILPGLVLSLLLFALFSRPVAPGNLPTPPD